MLKTCLKCGIQKNQEEFGLVRKKTKVYLRSECKPCTAISEKERRRSNQGAILKYDRERKREARASSKKQPLLELHILKLQAALMQIAANTEDEPWRFAESVLREFKNV